MKEHRIVFFDAGSVGNDITWPDFTTFGKVDVYQHSTKEEAINRIKDATIVLTNKTVISKEMIESAPHLAYIGTLSTGYNQVKIEAASAKGIPVCNVPDYSTSAVAQHTLSLILSLSADICGHNAAVQQGEWSKSLHFCFWNKPIVELKGKTLGIIGFGNTGQAVSALAHAFGMNILAYAPRQKAQPSYQPFSFASIDDIFSQSDVISLHCPLTPENKGLVNKERLACMKKSALLINCSRGPLVVSEDLAHALKNGVIAGAGLDVVAVEPMKSDDPLLHIPNCIITPHIAWASIEARTRLMHMAYDNIKAFIDGSPTNLCNNLS